MSVITSFYKSLSNFQWLKEQKNKPAKAWGYFFLFVLVLSLLTLIPLVVAAPKAVREARTEFLQKLPDFTATVNKGELSVQGVPQPYVWQDDKDGSHFLFVLDTATTTDLSLDDYMQKDTSVVLVTKDKFAYYDDSKGEERTQYWKDVDNFSVAKADVVRWVNTYLTGGILLLVGILVLVGVYIGLVISKLFSLLIASVFTLIVVSIAKRAWSFKEIFTVGLYAITLPSLISLVFMWLGVYIPLIHFLALLAFLLALVLTRDHAETVVAPPVKTEETK